jgi:uncharacterized RDD family membrane protein YckC
VRVGAGASAQTMCTAPSIKRRLVCMVYESFLVFAVAIIASLPFLGLAGMGAAGWMRHAYQGYLFLVIGAYFVWCWRQRGQTLAMKTWKLRLVGAGGARITLRQAMLRYACAWPSLLLGGIGLLYAYADPERQFLHDRLAGTRIVIAEA